MANKSAWIGGALGPSGLAYFNAFGAELNAASFVTGAAILSSIVLDNTAALDQFMDISFVGALSGSSAVPAGAVLSFFLAVMQADGATMGDGRLTAGAAPVAYNPIQGPIGGVPIVSGTITNIVGAVTGILIPPRKFSLVLQNSTTFTLKATGNVCQISTYRQNLNA